MALGVIFFLKTHRYSRLVVLYFGILNVAFVSLGRAIARFFIKKMLLKGRRIRLILVLGTGRTAKQFEEVIQRNRLYGYLVKAFVRLPEEGEVKVESDKILGSFEDLPRLLTEIRPHHVIFA